MHSLICGGAKVPTADYIHMCEFDSIFGRIKRADAASFKSSPSTNNITMYHHLLIVLLCCSAVQAGPLNLFVNVTIDDRPDLEIIEGDVAFDIGNAPTHSPGKNAYIRAAKWTGGILPYIIEQGSPFNAAQIQTITSSMRKIEQQTNNCIRFVQRTNQPTWVRIYSGSGCWSYMGRTKTSGAQDLSIGLPGCASQSVVIHELLHAVGFAHEQTRTDRDQSVSIQWGNIQSGQEHNFQGYTTSDVSTLGKAYDLGSIMHYRWNAFSKNGQATLLPRQAGVDKGVMGNTQQMTNLDIQKVKAYYNCA